MFIIILKMKTIDLFLVVDPTNLNMISVTKNAPDLLSGTNEIETRYLCTYIHILCSV